MRKWNSEQNKSAWETAVADMKRHGYTNYQNERKAPGFSHGECVNKMRGPHVAELVFGERECVQSMLASLALERLTK